MILAGQRIHAGQPIAWHLLPKDWRQLPFGAGTFDAVVASSVFEYIEDTEHALLECSRVLRPAGKLVFSAPNPAALRRKLERLLRPLAALAAVPPIRRLPRIGSYLTYLQLSHGGLSSEEWRQKAASAHLHPLEMEPAETEMVPDRAMLYFVFERAQEPITEN
jgi:ubiquinone/menaquinone biosynthesis C-methylase UbiE